MTPVNVDNFRAAETALVFDNQLVLIGGINRWFHYRAGPTLVLEPEVVGAEDKLWDLLAAHPGTGEGTVIALFSLGLTP